MRAELATRPRAVVSFVVAFGQVDSSHIHERFFNHQTHRTSCNDTLRSLVGRGYLKRFKHSLAEAGRGGGMPSVYQAGRRGHFLFRPDAAYKPSRGLPSLHTLGIVDCFMELARLERAGVLTIKSFAPGAPCHVTIGGIRLEPDMSVEVVITASGETIKLWLEMDMATEGRNQLKRRLAAFWRAYNLCDWPVFPRTVWVGCDNERAIELRRLVNSLPPEQQELFAVCTRETLHTLL